MRREANSVDEGFISEQKTRYEVLIQKERLNLHHVGYHLVLRFEDGQFSVYVAHQILQLEIEHYKIRKLGLASLRPAGGSNPQESKWRPQRDEEEC